MAKSLVENYFIQSNIPKKDAITLASAANHLSTLSGEILFSILDKTIQVYDNKNLDAAVKYLKNQKA